MKDFFKVLNDVVSEVINDRLTYQWMPDPIREYIPNCRISDDFFEDLNFHRAYLWGTPMEATNEDILKETIEVVIDEWVARTGCNTFTCWKVIRQDMNRGDFSLHYKIQVGI